MHEACKKLNMFRMSFPGSMGVKPQSLFGAFQAACLVGVAQIFQEEGSAVKPESLVGAFPRQRRSCLVGVAQILQEEGSAVKPQSLVGAISRQQRCPPPPQLGWRCPDTPRGGQRRKTEILGWSDSQAAEESPSCAACQTLVDSKGERLPK